MLTNSTGVQQRVILETAGSNYVLEYRKVSFYLEEPLALVAEVDGGANWLRLVDDVRAWALNTTEYFKVPDFVHEGIVPEGAGASWMGGGVGHHTH